MQGVIWERGFARIVTGPIGRMPGHREETFAAKIATMRGAAKTHRENRQYPR
jgi:hypothetical protein